MKLYEIFDFTTSHTTKTQNRGAERVSSYGGSRSFTREVTQPTTTRGSPFHQPMDGLRLAPGGANQICQVGAVGTNP
jgi:hypothetical protein